MLFYYGFRMQELVLKLRYNLKKRQSDKFY
jgi:hypothetical protein